MTEVDADQQLPDHKQYPGEHRAGKRVPPTNDRIRQDPEDDHEQENDRPKHQQQVDDIKQINRKVRKIFHQIITQQVHEGVDHQRHHGDEPEGNDQRKGDQAAYQQIKPALAGLCLDGPDVVDRALDLGEYARSADDQHGAAGDGAGHRMLRLLDVPDDILDLQRGRPANQVLDLEIDLTFHSLAAPEDACQ